MKFIPKDHYFFKAKKENYVSRAVYKIKEIDEKFKIFKRGFNVLDIGASPGSWTQYASEKIGLRGSITGIDIKDIKIKLPNFNFIKEDINKINIKDFLKKYSIKSKFNIILSDMAPDSTGIKVTDQYRSIELTLKALDFSSYNLIEGGTFIAKVFQSNEVINIRKEIKKSFKFNRLLKPKSSRKKSNEIFIVATNFNEN